MRQVFYTTKGAKKMGYKVKIQKVERPTNNSFYINFPLAIAESVKIEKGEIFEWFIEDRNTFVLKRIKKAKAMFKKLT
jgi:hypothetical protein